VAQPRAGRTRVGTRETRTRGTQATRARGPVRVGARLVARAQLPTSFGDFNVVGIEGRPGEEAVAILRGELNGTSLGTSQGNSRKTPRQRSQRGTAPLVRVHSQCLTGDVFTSERCDCRAQLEFSLKRIAKEPAGVLLYLPQEGRGIGLINKLKAYELQDNGLDTVQANSKLGFAADSRDYEFAAEALKALGVCELRLLSNNPDKVEQLESAGLRVVERVPCRPRTSHHSKFYLRTKKDKMGHLLA
jgi:GTP cyclohydrolase II